ncbi:MAG: sialidase family protein [Acidobacteria bacterium]|nr:sialidase family protein [Acidobacteriota bacterium]
MKIITAGIGCLALVLAGGSPAPVEPTSVTLLRVPAGGIQPRVVQADGTLHLLYYVGENTGGDLFYATSTDSATTFAEPVRVNTQAGSALSGGTIRGGEIALGVDGRVHVAWNGSTVAQPKGPLNPAQEADSPYNGTPFLYAHSDGKGGFSEQRNLMQYTFALDGGGTVAADGEGNVYAAWHGSAPDSAPAEAGRQLYLARSTDGGETFSEETAISDAAQGACGCCSAHLFAGSGGKVAAFYRTAREIENRDGFLLTSTDYGKSFQGSMLQHWQISACPMSSASFSEGPNGLFVSWETDGQVSFAPIDIESGKMTGEPIAAPGEKSARKHPSLAQNDKGEILLAWTEVGGWGQGGTVYWQLFDKSGKALELRGSAEGLPAWSFATAIALPSGEFAVMY